MSGRVDVAVIGGGLVGLATACRLLERRPDAKVVVLEKEQEVASHQSGRNSGVLHSGLYYAPRSWRALLCRQGKEQMEAFADEHAIAWRRAGKLVVAVEPDEIPRLRDLRARGEANGLRGLRELGAEELREIEPAVTGLAGLHVPETGVIDFRKVGRVLADEVRRRGGDVRLGAEVVDLAARDAARLVRLRGGEEFLVRGVVACAGLQSDRVAAMTEGRGDRRIVPFRGDYMRLRPAAASLVRGLVYPVPAPGLPFLGVHFTRRIDDEVWVGPNAVLSLAREGYGRMSVDLRDALDAVGFAGSWRLASRQLRVGAGEVWRDVWRPALARECRRYLPAVSEDDLEPASSGIRAQLLGADGSLVDDFVMQEGPGVLHVRNAPSPAATASLAIGAVLADRAAERFELG